MCHTLSAYISVGSKLVSSLPASTTGFQEAHTHSHPGTIDAAIKLMCTFWFAAEKWHTWRKPMQGNTWIPHTKALMWSRSWGKPSEKGINQCQGHVMVGIKVTHLVTAFVCGEPFQNFATTTCHPRWNLFWSLIQGLFCPFVRNTSDRYATLVATLLHWLV